MPLSFHFNGTIFYGAPRERCRSRRCRGRSAQFRMPVAVWRAMIAEHYPGGGWIRLSDETLQRLNARRAARGLPSFDTCVEELLDDA